MTISTRPTRKLFWFRWPLLIAVVPLVILSIVAIWVAIGERQASARITKELGRVREAGFPTDNVTMRQWFLANTHQEGSQAWSQILRMAETLPFDPQLVDQIPYLGGATVPETVSAPGTWKAEPLVKSVLNVMRPLLEEVHAATVHRGPVWQPLQFEGFSTLLVPLQSSRSVIRLLQLDIEHALYHRDSERAMRSLESLRYVTDAFNWELALIAELIHVAGRNIHQSMIRRSLSLDLWNEKQLVLLWKQVAEPLDIKIRWPRVIAGERALGLSEIMSDKPSAFGEDMKVTKFLIAFPTTHEALINMYARIERVGDGGIQHLVQRADVLETSYAMQNKRRLSPANLNNIGINLLMPAVKAFAVAMENEETSRRFTLTALAIKKYQLVNGQWPENLAQLSSVGLERANWRTVSQGDFGYEISETGVYLWSFEFTKQTVVPRTRPATSSEDGQSRPYVVMIR